MIFSLFSRRDYQKIWLLFGMIIVVAFFDMVGAASIMPFMTVLSNPEIIESNHYLGSIYNAIGLSDNKKFIVFLGACTLIIYILSLAMRAVLTYYQNKFIGEFEYNLSQRLVGRYLNQDYVWFLNKNSSELCKNILADIGEVIGGVLSPVLTLVTQIIISLALIGLLILSDIKLTVLTIIFIFLAYLIIYTISKKYIFYFGNKRQESNESRFRILSETFGAIKEIKSGHLELIYLKNFSSIAYSFSKYHCNALFIMQLPKFLLEGIAFGGILGITLYQYIKFDGLDGAIPSVALYAFIGYKLMPAANQAYSSFTQIKYTYPTLKKLHTNFTEAVALKKPLTLDLNDRVTFNTRLDFKNISFAYVNSKNILSDVNLTITAGTTVGVIGQTGAGKSTLIDIMMGLLNPVSGGLLVDQVELNPQKIKAWSSKIGYVPQKIFLTDTTILKNITLGYPDELIDFDFVIFVSKIAMLHDFVVKELPLGYETEVGERGVRLSGGQIQRIAIARALYRKPKLLIMDESTSGLDAITRQRVFEEIKNIQPKLTTVIVTHQVDSLKNCDSVLFVTGAGGVIQGSYEELKAIAANYMVPVVGN